MKLTRRTHHFSCACVTYVRCLLYHSEPVGLVYSASAYIYNGRHQCVNVHLKGQQLACSVSLEILRCWGISHLYNPIFSVQNFDTYFSKAISMNNKCNWNKTKLKLFSCKLTRSQYINKITIWLLHTGLLLFYILFSILTIIIMCWTFPTV